MNKAIKPRWKSMRTDETRLVEKVLKKSFPRTDAYRYNSASIRVRIVDPRFANKTAADRDALVEPLLEQLPTETQTDIMNLLTLAPNETATSVKQQLANEEFEDPSPSML
jgi:stress-induced morphogen